MADFQGKNSIKSTKELMAERVDYNINAFGSPLGPEQVLNFNFAERNFYGRVNREHDPVVALNEYIVSIRSSNNRSSTVMAMNFVADQFNDLESHFVRACRLGLIAKDDPILSSLKVVRGYVDPLYLYRSYSQQLMAEYNRSLNNIITKIDNFDDYARYFLHFLKNKSSINPLTFSAFQRSNHSSLFVSGLSIDLAGLSFGDDQVKNESLLLNSSFKYYLNLAKQYGFAVNKNNPSVLISDVGSPATAKYLEKYNITGVNSMFNQQFKKILFEDLELLKELLIIYYNSFVTQNPLKKLYYTCGSQTKYNISDRVYINNINNNNIIQLYIKIRNIEERTPYNTEEIKRIIQNALRMKKISTIHMLNYIDDQYKIKYNFKKGSLTYFKKRIQKKLDK